MVTNVAIGQLAVHPRVHEWLSEILKVDRGAATLTVRALQQVLEGAGVDGRRPLVGRLKGSRIRDLKELRPASTGHIEVRVLFAFDQEQRMVLLVAGDHSGNWTRWHREAVPLAEARYADYLDGYGGGLDDPARAGERNSLMDATAGGGWHGYRGAGELVTELSLTAAEIDGAGDITDAHIRAWHLAQVRRDQDRTQAEIAEAMGVTQPRVSEIEHGDLDRVTLSTLRGYVRSLGGDIQVVADLGDQRYRLV